MALLEGLSVGGIKTLALSVLAFAKPPPRERYPERLTPQLPWFNKPAGMEEFPALPPPLPECDAEPAPVSGCRRRTKAVKPTPQISAKQLLAWGEKTAEPLGVQPVQMHAFKLLTWINSPESGFNLDAAGICRGKPARGIFAYQLEEAYILMCAEAMWWKPLRWEGSNGVGEHFRRLTKRKKGYRYTNVDGIERRWCFYPVPAPVSARRVRKRTPEPTPKKAAKPQMKRAA